jgi:hypothetical protein
MGESGMIAADVDYVRRCLARGWIEGPCLELGAGIVEHSCHALLEDAGLEAVRTDMTPAPGLSFCVDFESDVAVIEAASGGRRFRTVLVLNVLEHTFDPVCVLDNALALVAPGGALVVITPTVWTLHSYPIDCWRVNPDFYMTYCVRRGLELVEGSLEFVGFGPVKRGADGTFELPASGTSSMHRGWSRLIHKGFNTTGRGHLFPSHISCSAVMRRPR